MHVLLSVYVCEYFGFRVLDVDSFFFFFKEGSRGQRKVFVFFFFFFVVVLALFVLANGFLKFFSWDCGSQSR